MKEEKGEWREDIEEGGIKGEKSRAGEVDRRRGEMREGRNRRERSKIREERGVRGQRPRGEGRERN